MGPSSELGGLVVGVGERRESLVLLGSQNRLDRRNRNHKEDFLSQVTLYRLAKLEGSSHHFNQ